MRAAFPLLLAGMAAASPAWSQASDDQQKQACMGDAFRLCLSDIPDRQAVRQCLVSRRDQLSNDCRHLIEAGASRTNTR